MNLTVEGTPIEKKRVESVKVREASFGDYDCISSIEARYGLQTKSCEEWTHLWLGNPAYKEMRKDWPIGWVLEAEGGDVVGYLGNIPLLYELEGHRLIAAEIHAWVVESAYRSYSLLLLDSYFRQTHVDLYLATSVNSQSSKSLGFADLLQVPVGAWDESVFWITHYPGWVASWAATKQLLLWRPMNYAVSGLFWLRDVIARSRWEMNDQGIEVACCDGFDDRFDVFWDALRKRKSELLLGVRTRESLDWHFRYAILGGGVWIVTIASGSDLVAYSILSRQDNPQFGLKRMRLVDFQVLDGNEALLRPMLHYALTKCREQGIHMLEYVGCRPEVRGLISSLAPYKRKLPSWQYYYKAANQRLAVRMADPKIWNPSGFDGDSSL